MRLKPIDQQVVVVMGASSGIGRAAALQFARKGARVVVSARSDSGLESLVEEIRAAGGEATAIHADVSEFSQVKLVADGAIHRYGQLDTWVHAAAVALYATFEETTPEEFRRVLEVNLLGQAHGAMAALPYLRTGGALIHISSVEAVRPMPYHSAYAASKNGIHGFVQVLRMELEHAGMPVSVTEVMPASINTPFFTKGRTKLGVKPMGLPPIYPPELVADAILHAAEHPVRELVVGGSGQVMVTGQRISPRLMDAMLKRSAFQGQLTDEPRGITEPDNLFRPVDGYNRVDGDFDRQAALMRYSRGVQSALQNNMVQWGLLAAAVGLVFGMASRRRA